jgi:cytochrome c oxidase cbb3-type subunit 4
MIAYLNAFSTILAMITFFGIVWWAFSSNRKKANQEAAMLPFALPDEGIEHTQIKKDTRP